jgi:hypothetical protein
MYQSEVYTPGPQKRIEIQKAKILGAFSNVKECVSQPVAKVESNQLEKAEKTRALNKSTTTDKKLDSLQRVVAEIQLMAAQVKAKGRRIN